MKAKSSSEKNNNYLRMIISVESFTSRSRLFFCLTVVANGSFISCSDLHLLGGPVHVPCSPPYVYFFWNEGIWWRFRYKPSRIWLLGESRDTIVAFMACILLTLRKVWSYMLMEGVMFPIVSLSLNWVNCSVARWYNARTLTVWLVWPLDLSVSSSYALLSSVWI